MATRNKDQPNIFSPVAYRYLLAAREIDGNAPQILDVGGYRSRSAHLEASLPTISYTSANVGRAWYTGEVYDIAYDGRTLPVADASYEYVISVDTMEHIERASRDHMISEMLRAASRRAVIVMPFDNGGPFFENQVLELSEKWGIVAMPSLMEHARYGLPTTQDVRAWCSRFGLACKFETDKVLYWQFQVAMLINQASLGSESEHLNRKLQACMEQEFASHSGPLKVEEAYRVVLTWNRP